MECHVFFHHRRIAGAQRTRQLTPCRWETDTNRVADAAVFFDTVFADNFFPGSSHVLALDPRLNHIERRPPGPRGIMAVVCTRSLVGVPT